MSFLAHLSQRLKWAIVIAHHPLSVRPSVRRRRPSSSVNFHISTSPLKPLNGIQRNLTESKISTPSTKFVFFRPIGKTKWPPWPLIGWDIFDFSSETAERISTKLDRKQDLNALYQVCVFRADKKNKMAALASDWLRHFRLLLWNRWTEFNETWQEARSQSPLPSLCFLGRSEKQDGRPGLWLAETFSTSPLNLQNGIQQNLKGSKITTPSTKFVFFGPIGKIRWPPWPLIGQTFSTSPLKPLNRIQRNLIGSKISKPSTKFVFFGPIGKTRWLPGLWLAETFSTSPLRLLNGIQRNLTGSKFSTPFTKFVFFRPIGKTKWPPWPLIGWDIFDFSSETAKRISTKLDRKQDLNALYQVCVFRADKKNKMAAMASDWLRHFRLLLWNRWTEFNETWQEARSQSPLPSLCFSGRSEKQDGCLAFDWLRHFRLLLWDCWMEFNETWQEATSTLPLPSLCFSGRSEKTKWLSWPLIGWDIFDFSEETAERNSMKLDRKQALNAFYHVCVFQANREKTKWPPWPLIGWGVFDFSTETAERNSMKLDRKQDLNALYQVCVFQVDRKNKMAAPAYDLLRHFQLFLWNRWIEFNKTWQEARSQHPLLGLHFSGWSEKQDSTLSSDWLRHFWLLLWNHWTECNETWQKASSQRPLPSLCFSGW